jgi:hypothetical protein
MEEKMEKVMFCFREEIIHLRIIIPESCFGKFVLGFGRVFRIEDPINRISCLKKIDDYFKQNTLGLGVDISFLVSEKQKFFNFLEEFCSKRRIGYPSFEEIFGK